MLAKHGNRTLRFRTDTKDQVLVIEDDIVAGTWSEIAALNADELLAALLKAKVLTETSPRQEEKAPD